MHDNGLQWNEMVPIKAAADGSVDILEYAWQKVMLY